MVAIQDADPYAVIKGVASELKSKEELAPPEWASFVKTGVHKERPPVQEDWWWVRAAAILRTVYKDGPIGVSKLRSKYGGRKNRGSKPEKFRKGSGNIIRKVLQQLDTAGLTKKMAKGKGRVILPAGQAILQKAANSVGVGKVVKEKKVKETPKVEVSKEEVKAEKKEVKAERTAPKVEEKKIKVTKVEAPKEIKKLPEPKNTSEAKLPRASSEAVGEPTVQEEIKEAVKEAEKKEAPQEIKEEKIGATVGESPGSQVGDNPRGGISKSQTKSKKEEAPKEEVKK